MCAVQETYNFEFAEDVTEDLFALVMDFLPDGASFGLDQSSSVKPAQHANMQLVTDLTPL